MSFAVISKIYSEPDLAVWQMPSGRDYREFVRSQLGPVEFGKTEQGKPYVLESEWRFNASHSGAYLLVVISRTCEVGVDIEQVRPIVHLERLVQRYFDGERIEDVDTFCRAWVRREALLKAAGVGIAGLARYRELPHGWRIVDLPVAPGYHAALVAGGS